MNEIHVISLFFDDEIICISNFVQIMEFLPRYFESKRITNPLTKPKKTCYLFALLIFKYFCQRIPQINQTTFLIPTMKLKCTKNFKKKNSIKNLNFSAFELIMMVTAKITTTTDDNDQTRQSERRSKHS